MLARGAAVNSPVGYLSIRRNKKGAPVFFVRVATCGQEAIFIAGTCIERDCQKPQDQQRRSYAKQVSHTRRKEAKGLIQYGSYWSQLSDNITEEGRWTYNTSFS